MGTSIRTDGPQSPLFTAKAPESFRTRGSTVSSCPTYFLGGLRLGLTLGTGVMRSVLSLSMSALTAASRAGAGNDAT